LGGAAVAAIFLAVHDAVDDPDIGYGWIGLAVLFGIAGAAVLRWWLGMVRIRQEAARMNEWLLRRLRHGPARTRREKVDEGDDWP
jgi:hypothetical protein